MPPDQNPDPAALVALAWVYLERGKPRRARRCLKQADAALSSSPDKLTGALACLVAAGSALAERRAAVAVQIITRTRSGWAVPGWLDHRLSLAESRAHAAIHRRLLVPAVFFGQLSSPASVPDRAPTPAVAPLSERQRQVLRHVSDMLTIAEIAGELCMSVDAVSTTSKNLSQAGSDRPRRGGPPGPASSS